VKALPFVTVGALLAALAATLIGLRGGAAWDEALLLGLPLGFMQAVLCFAARYPARAAPLAPGKMFRVAATHLSAAIVATGVWVFAGTGLARSLEWMPRHAGAALRFEHKAPTLAVTGVLIFLLAVTAHYLLIALEAAREAEVGGVRARVLAREAELRALRAQIDPHFLFNSLNSIAALTAEDPGAARSMCLQLAGFLRRSLALGQRDRVSLGEELALAGDYLAIEKIRFGTRLGIVETVEEGCRDCPVPPLLLQPIVENAVRHGIAQIVEGGRIEIVARRDPEGVVLTVENPRDPERAGGQGAGLGLENVRGRLRALHGEKAQIDVASPPTAYKVRLFIPWAGPAPAAAGLDPLEEASHEPA
jgi:two-component system, LytTR family, sensor histidine kinase AlgZ